LQEGGLGLVKFVNIHSRRILGPGSLLKPGS
jgi:hypothetical protein